MSDHLFGKPFDVFLVGSAAHGIVHRATVKWMDYRMNAVQRVDTHSVIRASKTRVATTAEEAVELATGIIRQERSQIRQSIKNRRREIADMEERIKELDAIDVQAMVAAASAPVSQRYEEREAIEARSPHLPTSAAPCSMKGKSHE